MAGSLLWIAAACVPLLVYRPPVELLRALLTRLYHVQSHLPAALAKQWRLGATLLLQLVPAMDPAADPYLTAYDAPPCAAGNGKSAVLITGATGMVGLHLMDLLLRTTDARVYAVVRRRSLEKLRRDAGKYGLALPQFEGRVTILDGDCKKRHLGLGAAAWRDVERDVGYCFHLAANSSFVATYEILRSDWMPSYVDLLEFCARAGVAFHLVGSVGRFAVAVPENRTRRGVWTSGYMRQKYVQYELLQKFFARGLGGSWTDCAYILGTVAGGGANPGFHDSMWKAAAIQRAVGVAFPGDATLVPVDALVEALWVNATAGAVAPYMSLRLKRVLASADIGVATTVCAADFWRAADAAGFPRVAVRAFVPPDIDALVAAMHRPFEAPPAVRAIFDAVDEEAVIAANFAYARREFGALEA